MLTRKLARLASITINQASRVAAFITTVTLVAMVMLTVIDVFLRFVFRAPILGSVEITEYMMVTAGFLGMAWCAQKGGHVVVGILVDRLPKRIQHIFDCITLSVGLAIVPLVIWQSFAQSGLCLEENYTSDLLKIPQFPFYIIVGIGYIILFFVILTILINSIKKAVKNES